MPAMRKLEGARAFDQGDERSSCPYDAGSIAAQDWQDGWAQKKAANERADQAHALQTQLARVG